MPESIERIYVKPAAPPAAGGKCGNPYISYCSLERGLEAVRREDSRIVLLPSYSDYRVRYMLSEWKERTNGGDGC